MLVVQSYLSSTLSQEAGLGIYELIIFLSFFSRLELQGNGGVPIKGRPIMRGGGIRFGPRSHPPPPEEDKRTVGPARCLKGRDEAASIRLIGSESQGFEALSNPPHLSREVEEEDRRERKAHRDSVRPIF